MKGACIYTDRENFIDLIVPLLQQHQPKYDDIVFYGHTVQVVSGGLYFTLYFAEYDSVIDEAENKELQNHLLLEGKNHSFMIDCRHEKLFCEIIKYLDGKLPNAFLIIDNGDWVLRPCEITPETIKL
jgi:hypothetical protein